GLLTIVVTFVLGLRLAGPRAGLLAALILMSFPLFIMQSRQLMSDMGTLLGGALIMLGLVGLAWPTERRAPWLYAADLVLVAIGAVLSYLAAAALIGLFIPFAAMALACVSNAVHWQPSACPGGSTAPRSSARPGEYRPATRYPILGLSAIALGAALALIGHFAGWDSSSVPIAVIAVGVLVLAFGLIPRSPRPAGPRRQQWQRWHLIAVLLGAGAMAVATFLYVFGQVFDLRDPIPGQRALFGYSLMPSDEYADALGGIWRLNDDLKATFNNLFEHIAYGLYPWSALAPIALAHLAMAPRGGRHTWAGQVACAWAAVAWVVATVTARKMGPSLYPGVVAVALGLGLWLDGLISARHQSDATGDSDLAARTGFGVSLRLPVVALFVALAALVLGKDLFAFPDKLVALTAEDVKYPDKTRVLKIGLKYWPLVFGAMFAAAMAAGLLLWQRCRQTCAPGERRSQADNHVDKPLYKAGRWGIHAAVAVTLVMGLFTAHVWLPALSQKLSSKHVFAVFSEMSSEGDELGIMGNYGSSAEYYAPSYEKLSNRTKLIEFLRKPSRVFALAPASELCAFHRSAKGTVPYHVIDDSNAKFLLFSNQLGDGERDLNPLARTMVRTRPDNIEHPLKVNYDNRLELIGYNMPDQVNLGDEFEMTLFFKVLRPVGGTWKIFVHFDGGLRFQGDHDPVETVRCATSYWQAGDYVINTITVKAGGLSYKKGTYQVLVGLFRGSTGNWKNMKVADPGGKKVDENYRVTVGQLQVR
ncbi:MAG: hypothetical protein AAGC55_01415, partial [Myxococcota bacterium]